MSKVGHRCSERKTREGGTRLQQQGGKCSKSGSKVTLLQPRRVRVGDSDEAEQFDDASSENLEEESRLHGTLPVGALTQEVAVLLIFMLLPYSINICSRNYFL